MEEQKGFGPSITRRCVLASAGKLAVGTAALATGGAALAPRAEAKETPFPWPYRKLDPREVGELAYERFPTGLCANAVLTALVAPLRRSIGEPYTSFPVDAFVFGHGGVVGWGTLCGTMLGASIAASLVAGPGIGKAGEQIANEVIHYYTDTELPRFRPGKARLDAAIPANKADSPLCHVSVNKWMTKANRGFWTPERKERCARLAADVAMKTAALLNDLADGRFKPAHASPALRYDVTAQHDCRECHGNVVPDVVTTGNPARK